MKTLQIFICSLLLVFILPTCASGQEKQTVGEEERTYYYGVEISDVLCGYAEVTSLPEMKDGREILRQEGIVTVKLSVLGGGVDLIIETLYFTDPATEQFTYNTTTIIQGETRMDFTSVLNNDSILFTSTSGNDRKSIPVTPNLILEGPLTTIHLVKDFIKGGSEEKTYKVYDPARGVVVEKTYTREEDEELLLAGNTYNCMVLNEFNPAIGISIKQWYDLGTGLNIQTLIANRRIFLSDPSVVKNITTANLDDMLFAKVNTKISDLHNIAYMKVKAKINSAGEKITPESLSHNGQSFTGTVNENLIDGIFETATRKYDGKHVPPFPPDFSGDPDLVVYLKPENLIESNNPILMDKSREITNGSADSWEAVRRLSKWVAENIEGAVPGGTSAINTYKTRQGECGSHSRLLTAFCRAVGIPARLSVGCMYSSLYGGSFGQHAWTEVWMGEAGWIPVDATAFEIDFIDAGHIRLGEKTSFNPEEMEILEYRMTGGETEQANQAVPVDYQPYLGKYTDLERNRTFTALYQNNTLAVDIPGQMAMVLNEPGEDGRWYPQITRQLYFLFPKSTVGTIETMIVTQVVPIPKKQDNDSLAMESPENLKPLVGTYSVPQANITLDVTAENEMLSIPDLIGRTKNRIILKRSGDSWNSENGQYSVKFETNETGEVTRMVTSISFTFTKGEPAANILEKVIEEEGIETGLKRYAEMRDTNRGEYIFSEKLLNALGYKLLNQEKVDDAIEVFKLNTQDHPDSFNVYDSLGEAYMKNGDTDLAIKNYKKSLELNPDNENGKKMLEQLQSGQ
ncbi:MAG: tetratricopeptide repeat protein [Bacteroidales bacterium]|nr:tetratricopeptide repeat protein [Bacteroidales bacterium]